MLVWLLLAVICSGQNQTSCHFMRGSLPMEFKSQDECLGFGLQATIQGMSYKCEEGVEL